jgi:hypothetical protein
VSSGVLLAYPLLHQPVLFDSPRQREWIRAMGHRVRG